MIILFKLGIFGQLTSCYPQKKMIHCQPYHEMSLCTQTAMAYSIYYTALRAFIYIALLACAANFWQRMQHIYCGLLDFDPRAHIPPSRGGLPASEQSKPPGTPSPLAAPPCHDAHHPATMLAAVARPPAHEWPTPLHPAPPSTTPTTPPPAPSHHHAPTTTTPPPNRRRRGVVMVMAGGATPSHLAPNDFMFEFFSINLWY